MTRAMAGTHPQQHDEAPLVTRVEIDPEVIDQYIMPQFPPNLATIIEAATDRTLDVYEGQRPDLGHAWFINPIFSILYAILIIVIIRIALRRASMRNPTRLQNAVETLMGGLRNFFGGVMGHRIADRYIPFIGSLWIFIFVNNAGVLVPGMKSPTYSWKLTFALALVTFFYVQYTAIRAGGIGNWLRHLAGEPIWLAPLLLPLHVMGEIIRPVSLALRLFGNIFGEDKLLAAFLGMGMLATAAIFGTVTPPIGLPLAFPFYFLVLLLSIVQATVFSLLASIYILLMLPHDDHEEEHEARSPAAAASPETAAAH